MYMFLDIVYLENYDSLAELTAELTAEVPA